MFKVGDRVICVVSFATNLQEGNEYVIRSISVNGDYLNLMGFHFTFDVTRFKLSEVKWSDWKLFKGQPTVSTLNREIVHIEGDTYAYRKRIQPVVETIELTGTNGRIWSYHKDKFATHKISYQIIDGEIDCASMKMEKL